MSTPLGKYISEKLITEKLSHSNGTGVETILLSIITEGSKEFAVWSGSEPLGGASLENTTSLLIIIHSNQAIATIDKQVNGDPNISLGILESHIKFWRGGIFCNSNYCIGMNP